MCYSYAALLRRTMSYMQSAFVSPELLLIHVAIVEDDHDFCHALSQVIQVAEDMRLVGVANTRLEGLAMLAKPPADVLLVDLGLPDGSGIDIIKAASTHWPSCNLLVSTNFGDETHVMRYIQAGAAGYLLEDSATVRVPG